jgi:hypothetical protein
MIIHNHKCSFKNLEALIARVRRRRNLSELETGLLNVATNTLARAEHGADAETLRCLMAMAEKIEAILHHKPAEVIDLTGYFRRSVGALAPRLNRRWDSRVSIKVRRAA